MNRVRFCVQSKYYSNLSQLAVLDCCEAPFGLSDLKVALQLESERVTAQGSFVSVFAFQLNDSQHALVLPVFICIDMLTQVVGAMMNT